MTSNDGEGVAYTRALLERQWDAWSGIPLLRSHKTQTFERKNTKDE